MQIQDFFNLDNALKWVAKLALQRIHPLRKMLCVQWMAWWSAGMVWIWLRRQNIHLCKGPTSDRPACSLVVTWLPHLSHASGTKNYVRE